MVSWWLILIAVILALGILGLTFYFVWLYSSEDDKNQAWLPKIIVMLGLSFATYNVLLLPYDVANRFNPQLAGSAGGGINIVLMWEIVSWTIAGFTFVIVPFAMFYYEAWEPEQENIWTQVKPALCYTLVTVFVFVGLLVLLWLTVGIADIPYTLYSALSEPFYGLTETNFAFAQSTSSQTLSIKVSIFVYLVGLMSAVGWVLFFVFAGVGLASLPMDLISNFKNRPQPITVAEYTVRKERIGESVTKLIADGKDLDQKERDGASGAKHRTQVLKFKKRAAALEEAFEKLETEYKFQGGSVLQAWLGLIIGILSVALSLTWFLHVIIWNIAGANPFLNNLFIALDSAFSLFGVVAYGFYAFYLLWCVVKGCAKFGLNFLIFTVHPMKVNGTLMNSFLFNTMLILISSTSVVQFCAISFQYYAANTAVSMMYTTYVSRLKGLNYITQYLQYPMVAMAVLTFLYLAIVPKCCRPSDDDE
jgi:LMBR1 domain-containing protein 1